MSEPDVSGLLNNHLKDKFLNLLNRIKKHGPSKVPQISRFESIKTNILGSRYFWFDIKSDPSVSIELRDLIDALSECRTFANQRDAALKKSLLLRFVSPSELWLERKMKSRLLNIENKLKLARDNSTLVDTFTNGSLEFDPKTSQGKYASEVIGFDEVSRKIETGLTETNQVSKDGFTAIAIVGSGGSGKTALARKLFDRMTGAFDISIWLCLSEISSWEEHVVQHILKAVGFDYDSLKSKLDIVDFLKEIHKILDGKRYLIVLDDIQHMKDFYVDLGFKLPEGGKSEIRLSHALPKGSGGTVIVTTRLENEPKEMVGDRNVFHLDSLPNELCWSIFKRSLNLKDDTQNELQDIEKMKHDIMDFCDGLPLVAKALAEMVSSRHSLP